MAISEIDSRIEYVRSFDGTRIATAAWGDSDAPAIILSNGIACSDTYWTYLQPELVQAGYRVVFFDYRGHNRSGRPGNPNEVGLTAHSRDLWAVADHHGIGEALLVGHSMGVQTIFEAYRQHPERVKGLVALAGPFEYPLDNLYMTPIGAVLLAGFGLTFRHAPLPVRAIWDVTGLDTRLILRITRLLGAMGRKADKALLNEYFQNLSQLDPLLMVRFFEGMQNHSARDLLPSCDLPVLQIAGGLDMLTPLPLQREMAAMLPNVRFENFPRSSHTLPIDEPDRVNERVLRFIREVEESEETELS